MRRCRMSFDALADYCAGTATKETVERIQAHLSEGCAECQNHCNALTTLLAGMKEVGKMTTPAYSLEPARALFRERMQSPQRPPLFARLMFDGGLTPALAGFRGGKQTTAYKRLFSTVEHDIDLWHEPLNENDWYVIGQALPREGSEIVLPVSAQMTATSGNVFAAQLDGNEFHFASLPVGSYTLNLNLPIGEIIIPDMRIGA